VNLTAIPFYLQERLKYFGINSTTDLIHYGYLQVFSWLRDKYPSISYKSLYDLYCLASNIPINSLSNDIKKQLYISYKENLPCYAPIFSTTITKYLDLAYKQAQLAATQNEIPIAALLVKDDMIIASAYNLTTATNSMMKHAEIIALEQASLYLGNKYLSNCDLYVTTEPCLMCSGAIMASRIKRLIFGAIEAKTGAVVSQYQVFNNKLLNHHTQTIGPIDNAKYSQYLREFFRAKR
jgi:tRNA(Arg) A34 adenosine deaminase TadA